MTATQTPRSPTRWQLLLAWSAVVLPIAAWTAHITAVSALTRLSCTHSNVVWIMHGITAATALVCVACIIIGVRYARAPAGAAGNGAFRFLGGLVVMVAAINLLVIVWEGAYIPFLQMCHG